MVATASALGYRLRKSNQIVEAPMTILEKPITWFSIPVADMDRAVAFYNAVFGMTMQVIDFQGEPMAPFPMQEPQPGGALVVDAEHAGKGPGCMIYLNGGDDLQAVLDKLPAAGGSITIPKTLISEEVGYFAHFLDTEGNEVGVYSPK
jgi:hypothetical protein